MIAVHHSLAEVVINVDIGACHTPNIHHMVGERRGARQGSSESIDSRSEPKSNRDADSWAPTTSRGHVQKEESAFVTALQDLSRAEGQDELGGAVPIATFGGGVLFAFRPEEVRCRTC